SGDDAEYQRIYATKIKPRLRSEEGPEAEAGGTQSRTITVTRKVTAYTVDVTRRDGDLEVSGGHEGSVRIPMTLEGSVHSPMTLEGSVHSPMTPTEPPQIPGGQTGKWPGPARVEANGQTGEPDASGRAPWPQGQVRVAGAAEPPVDVGKIKIPALKIPKFGVSAPQVDVEPGVIISSAGPAPQVDMGVKGVVKVPSPTPPDISAPDGAKIKIPHLTFPKFSAPDARVDGVDVAKGGVDVPKVTVGVPEVAVAGEWKGPTFKKAEMPQISLSDVTLKGPKGVKVDAGCGLRGVAAPEMDIGAKGWKGGVDVAVAAGAKGPRVDIKGPQVGVEVPGVDIKGPEVTTKTPQISLPDIDLNLKTAGAKGNLDISAPKLEGELKTPGVDIKGPEVTTKTPQISLPDIDLNLRAPKIKGDLNLKMPKFGVKGESPELEVTVPKGGVDISGPGVDIGVGSVDITGPRVDIEAPE
ncbi:AHNK protein, partial [Malurus elegans]|nr:AHNK protein [Malurus elegans]